MTVSSPAINEVTWARPLPSGSITHAVSFEPVTSPAEAEDLLTRLVCYLMVDALSGPSLNEIAREIADVFQDAQRAQLAIGYSLRPTTGAMPFTEGRTYERPAIQVHEDD